MAPFDSAGFTSGTGDSGDGKDATKVSNDDIVVVKAQKSVDQAPFVRYGCWHCTAPSCASACPQRAIKKLGYDNKARGAVIVDYDLCNPDSGCNRECIAACRKGGYPKIGQGTSDWFGSTVKKMYKCDMCYDRIEAGKLPACVETCPAKAYTFDTLENLSLKISSGGFQYVYGNSDNFLWATRLYAAASPKADPFVEDHISPMMDRLLSGPFGKAALVPTAVVGGLYALYRRRVALSEEESLREGV